MFALILPMHIICINLNASNNYHISVEMDNGHSIRCDSAPTPLVISAKTFKEIDEMPRFPGCESRNTIADKTKCAHYQLTQFIHSNIRYSKGARDAKIHGLAIVKFVVLTSGEIAGITVLKDPGGGLGFAAKQAVEVMNKMNIRWTPGILKGEKVNVEYILPVKFKLEGIVDSNIVPELENQIEVTPAHINSSQVTSQPSIPKSTVIPDSEEKLNDSTEARFMIVDEMPRFPGCENNSKFSKAEKEECSKKLLLEFLSQNVKYPEEAKEKGIKGQAIIQFTVIKNGTIKNAMIINDPGYGLGEAARQAVLCMNTQGKVWKPGIAKGVPVNVQYTVPVKIGLVKNEEIKKDNQINDVSFINTSGKLIYKSVEEMPRFPGCESKGIKYQDEKKKCADELLMMYLGSTVQYPSEARGNGKEGQAVIQFNVMSNGSLEDIVILRDPGGGLGEAARQAVLTMVSKGMVWIPGKENGVAVNVQYKVPLKFKLNN